MSGHWHVAHHLRMLFQFATGPDDHLMVRLAGVPDNRKRTVSPALIETLSGVNRIESCMATLTVRVTLDGFPGLPT